MRLSVVVVAYLATLIAVAAVCGGCDGPRIAPGADTEFLIHSPWHVRASRLQEKLSACARRHAEGSVFAWRMSQDVIWELWRSTGRSPFDQNTDEPFDSLRDISAVARFYREFIVANRKRSEEELQREGVAEAIELLKTPYSRPALLYLLGVLQVCCVAGPWSAPLLLSDTPLLQRKEAYRYFAEWYTTEFDCFRWHAQERAFVQEHSPRAFPPRILLLAIEAHTGHKFGFPISEQ